MILGQDPKSMAMPVNQLIDQFSPKHLLVQGHWRLTLSTHPVNSWQAFVKQALSALIVTRPLLWRCTNNGAPYISEPWVALKRRGTRKMQGLLRLGLGRSLTAGQVSVTGCSASATSAASSVWPSIKFAAHVQVCTQRYARAFASGEQVGGPRPHHEALPYRTLRTEALLGHECGHESPAMCIGSLHHASRI